MGLIDAEYIEASLTKEAPFCESHGAQGSYLGIGLMYYSLVYARRSRVAVCLGSGGGFVPRLMRQAQRDLGIAADSRTILVDANLPQAGWGSPQWLDEGSFFRSQFSDIEIVMSTTQAAIGDYFVKNGIKIDYLHIDADHSFRGCLADFQDYRPLLTNDAIVTLHDTNFYPAGVSAVIEYLRTRPDCEVVDFPEQGVGTAIVRIRGPIPNGAPATFGHAENAVTLTRVSSTPVEPPMLGWSYLESPAYQTRSMIAAHFVRDCQTVIELGAGKYSMDGFLGNNQRSIFLLDPLLHEEKRLAGEGGGPDVWRLRATFQDVKWNIHRPGEYGLVLLGMELQNMSEENYRDLFDLIDQARVTVIEFPPSYEPSKEQFQRICANTRTRQSFQCKLDLLGNDVGNLFGSWRPRWDREIHVLEPVAG